MGQLREEIRVNKVSEICKQKEGEKLERNILAAGCVSNTVCLCG